MTDQVYPKVITDLPEADIPFEGIKGWLLQGPDRQVVFFDIQPVGVVPEHCHGEQWGVVVEGELTLVVEGVKNTYRKGEFYHIASGARHSATFGTACKVMTFLPMPIGILQRADPLMNKGK